MTQRRAQSTVEYAVAFAIVVSAAIGMQVYLKRAVMGRYERQMAQTLGEDVYLPGQTTADETVTEASLPAGAGLPYAGPQHDEMTVEKDHATGKQTVTFTSSGGTETRTQGSETVTVDSDEGWFN